MGRLHDHGQLLFHNLQLIDLTRAELRCITTASVFRRLTKGILSRSDLIAHRGGSFSLFQLIRSLLEGGREHDGSSVGAETEKRALNARRIWVDLNLTRLTTLRRTSLPSEPLPAFRYLSLFLSLSLILDSRGSRGCMQFRRTVCRWRTVMTASAAN